MLPYSFDGARNPCQRTKWHPLVNASSPICPSPYIGASLGVHAHCSVLHRLQFHLLGCSTCPDSHASRYRRVTFPYAMDTIVRYHSAQSSYSIVLGSHPSRLAFPDLHSIFLIIRLFSLHFCASLPCPDIRSFIYRRVHSHHRVMYAMSY